MFEMGKSVMYMIMNSMNNRDIIRNKGRHGYETCIESQLKCIALFSNIFGLPDMQDKGCVIGLAHLYVLYVLSHHLWVKQNGFVRHIYFKYFLTKWRGQSLFCFFSTSSQVHSKAFWCSESLQVVNSFPRILQVLQVKNDSISITFPQCLIVAEKMQWKLIAYRGNDF